MIRMNNNKVITVESLDEQLGGLIRKINRQNTPFYKNPLLEKMITVLMIVSEAVALVATIISFNSRISPLFTIPITTTYVVLFVVLGFFQGRTIGAYLLGNSVISKKRVIAGIVLNAVMVAIPIAAVGWLRWTTRQLGQSIVGTGADCEATMSENAFGVVVILLPVCIFIIEAVIVILGLIYDSKSHPTWVTKHQYHELVRLRDQIEVLSNKMPEREEHAKSLKEEDNARYHAAAEMIVCMGNEVIVKAREELMKSRKMNANDVNVLTASDIELLAEKKVEV